MICTLNFEIMSSTNMNVALKSPSCVLRDGTGVIRQFVDATNSYIMQTHTHLNLSVLLPINFNAGDLALRAVIPFDILRLTHLRAV